MNNMDKKTHLYLTILLFIAFVMGYTVILLLNNNPVISMVLFTSILVLSIYNHKRYYSHNHVDNKAKIILIINMVLVFILLYYDYSNFEELFLLILMGDCIFAYDFKFSAKYVLFANLFYFPYAYFVLYNRPVGEYAGDIARDFVVISFIVLILFIAKYQMTETMKYNNLVEERNKALKKIKEMTLNEERNRIALILHNSLGHLLVSTNMSLQAEKMELLSKGKIEKDTFKTTEKLISEAMSLLRKTINNHDDSFLGVSLEKLLDMFICDISNNTNVEFGYNKNRIRHISEKYKDIVYNIILETVTNSMKHSNCDKIDITLDCKTNQIEITIKDNGMGFKDLKIGYGIAKIKERIEDYKGSYEIISDNGCTTTVTIPMNEVI